MDNDIKYLEEHHQITESAIGLVKLKLQEGDCIGAKLILDDCSDKLKSIIKLYQPNTAKMLNL